MSCQFSTKEQEVTCSVDLVNTNVINWTDLNTVFTECGLLPDKQHSIPICLSHFDFFLDQNYKRCRRKVCGIPDLINCHKIKDEDHRKDRSLTIDHVRKICSVYGIVLPVGTGICKGCRKELLQGPEELVQDLKTESTVQVRDQTKNESVNNEDGDNDDEDGPVPAKRVRKSIQSETIDVLNTPTNSQESQVSEASVCRLSKMEALNFFLGLSGESPVKLLQQPLCDASERTQRRYTEKASRCMHMMFDTICPGEADSLIDKVVGTSINSSTNDETTLEILAEIYKQADTWTLERQILSIIVQQHSFEDVAEWIPDMTNFRYKTAKKHAKEFGVGKPVASIKHGRERYENFQVEHFIEFIITSSHVMKDLPFGEKTLRLSSGEIIKIPSVIRSLAPTTIIKQYTALCEEETIKPLGNSTLYKLLDECSAVVRKSIEGLDNFVMEGCRAFSNLDSLIGKMENITKEDFKLLKEGLQNGKRYLKSDLKVHLSKESTTADHCLQYALSTAEKCFKSTCTHDHQRFCQDCNNLESVMILFKAKAEEEIWENEESIMYTIEEAISAIKKWKAHTIRSVNQDRRRTQLVDSMSDDEVIITSDWAMKFLPRKFREGQVDWFAKRGINWHIAVSLCKVGQTFSTITYVHIFESPVSQDAAITAEILIEVGRDIMKQRPSVKKLHYFSDNAGCYKSSTTLLMLKRDLSDNLTSYNFCEAQNGKGPCDRRAAHLKSIIRRYINEGNNVTTAAQMKQAIDGDKKTDILVKVVSHVSVLDVTIKKITIPAISQLYNFEYGIDGLRMWRAFEIGSGKILQWDKLDTLEKTVELKTVVEWGIGNLHYFERDEGEHQQPAKKGHKNLFECPFDTCSRIFSNTKALDDHMLLGDCGLDVSNHQSLNEKAKKVYATKIQGLFPQKTVYINQESRSTIENAVTLDLGWALKESKAQTKFNEKTKEIYG